MSSFTAEAMREVQAQVVRALADNDPDLFASLYAPDGALLPPDGSVAHGRDAIAAFFKGAVEHGFRTQTLEDVQLTVSNTIAVEEGIAIAGFANGSSVRSNYVVIYTQQPDGSWLMHRDIWTAKGGQ